MPFKYPPGYQTIHDPKIPYVGPIYGGLTVGMSVYIKGTVLTGDINRFHVNLQYGEDESSDKALHFNPRFQGNGLVVFNNMRYGCWKTEERVDEMPFHQGENFVLLITVTSDGYQVKVDGQHFYMFKHRMPVERVRALVIAGDTTIQLINILGGGQGGIYRSPDRGNEVPMPYVEHIRGGLRPGMSVHIQGSIPENLSRFYVNFRCGGMKCSDIALHFNPRFGHREVVVFNSSQSGSWRREERRQNMPFRRGESFDLVFAITSAGYQVNVNNQPFLMFRHRIPVKRVEAVEIDGEVSVQTVNIIGGGKRVTPRSAGPRELMVHRIPFVGAIPGGLRPGSSLLFQGKVHTDGHWFHINLQSGQMRGADIALHFNPRLRDGEVIVFNSYRHGWRREERVREMPFTKGEEFELIIAVTSVGYQVKVNDQDLDMFRHRIPLDQVKALEIDGDVSIQTVSILDEEEDQMECRIGRGLVSIPHVRSIQGGLRPGMSLSFKGSLPQELNRFKIDLQDGEARGSDIALHFNPRFWHNGGGVVVLNSLKWGRWGREEKPDDMPFRKGEEFELLINVTTEGFQVKVNGQQFHMFKHRMPVEQVTTLVISGEVSMQDVSITEEEQAVPDRAPVMRAPYLQPIFSGLRTGMSVYIQGNIPYDVDRFFVNFDCGEMKFCEKALHINPRFSPMELVVFNSFQRGRWRREDRIKAMPFSKGDDFELLILITSRGYRVKVNGRLFHVFQHRIPVERVSSLQIGGDVNVRNVNILEGGQGDMQIVSGLEELKVERIPYMGPIYGGLRTGMSMVFRGMILNHSKRFHINLQCGEMKYSDIALHFNPRFRYGEVIVFNSYHHGWRREERVREMPFRKGEDFKLIFVVTSEGYQVKVNDQDLYLFKHRTPVERVKALSIAGDVSIHGVNILEASEGEARKMMDGPGGETLSIPCVRHIPGGLRPGMSLYFLATIPEEINRFHINLQCGERDGADIALHFNPRFTGSGKVVLNTFWRGSWDLEDQKYWLPFTKGETFALLIAVTSEGYQVKVNDEYFHIFRHRMPVQRVSSLLVDGDISLHSIDIIGGGPRSIQEDPVKMLNTPYVRPIYVGLKSGMSVYVQGKVPQNINKFFIDFKCGETKYSDIALRFKPQFSPFELVAFNFFRHNRWRRKDKVRDMPFRKGEDFELLFVITSEGYQVNINGQEFHTFKHRIPAERVTTLEIRGQVFVQNVDIIKSGQDDMFGYPSGGEITIPNIPYVGPISGGLRPGMSLVFQGSIPYRFNRFHINLQSGEMRHADKALHFNPRFGYSPVVVFNSFRYRWKKEERVYEMPFREGENFELVINVTTEGYQVNINDCEFYLFRHRMPVEQVKALEIAGDVSMRNFTIVQEEQDEIQRLPAQTEALPVPQSKPIMGSLRPGMSVFVRGLIPSDSNRFSINLNCGRREGCDNALHINPRFDTDSVVFNTYRYGCWENEESPREMPFRKGEEFELLIFVTSEGYQINVNGEHFHLFMHRMPLRRVQAVATVGDVTLYDLNIVREEQCCMPMYGVLPEPPSVDPNTPYLWPICDGLRKGMSVYIQGTVPNKLDRFYINFTCGEMRCSDIALHFNPRFSPYELVVFNSYRHGWKREERVNKMPFSKGEHFEMVITVISKGYKVNVNGYEFHTFRHRMAPEYVTALQIGGKVFVENIDILEGGIRGENALGVQELVINNIPYVGPITGGLKPGMSLYFHGTIPRKIDRFHINLKCGEAQWSDVALHFNPRFRHGEVVVLNSFEHAWKKEERAYRMPFTKGDSFELVIAVTSEGYQMIVNGRKFYLFRHRVPLERVRALEIVGDVTMHMVNLNYTNTPYKSLFPDGLKSGMSLRFVGRLPHVPDRFSINLLCGEQDGMDNAFHFNPRFKPREMVVFNSLQKGKWMEEERKYQMPFHDGESFELVYNITEEGYQVEVNNRQFYLFKHRIPMEQVRYLKIEGEVTLEDFEITEGKPKLFQFGPGGLMTTPYERPIVGGLRSLSALFFQGTVNYDADRFSINLICGDNKDNAFHFNPRLECNEVVLNTLQNGQWEEEEKPAGMPFRKGQSFEILILMKWQGYQVLVNGRKFCLFRHRIPMERVTDLEIAGDVTFRKIELRKRMQEAIKYPGEPDPPSIPGRVIGYKPYFRPISSGLKPNMLVTFQGRIPYKIRRFHINFKCGEDIALHFNPRFCPYEVVVFNSQQHDSWETEERVTDMLFSPGQSFELTFLVTLEGYQVSLNGSDFYLFKHRIPMEQVTGVEITGDVSVESIDVIRGAPDCIQFTPVWEDGEPDDFLFTPGGIVVDDGQDSGIQGDQDMENLPYVETIPDGLKPGMSLYFQGSVPYAIDRFSINLLCGDQDGCDNALHLNPRFDSNVVVFNTFQNSSWENEERPSEMPFSRGEDFEVLINVTPEGYQVNVNDTPFYFFKHRIPVEQVSSLKIIDDVYMRNIDIIKGGYQEGCDDEDMVFSYDAPIYGGLKIGKSLYFQGTIPCELDRFSINLQCGETKDSDIALLFNPRLESSVVVFNSFQDGAWGKEETVNEMPFHEGESFELLFDITSEGYQVVINGRQFYLFKHRMLVDLAKTIQIDGDVSMQTITTIEGGEGDIQEQPSVDDSDVAYTQSIPDGFKAGESMYIQGSIPEQINSFIINLQCGKKDGSDIALQFKPQFDTSEVLFNSFLKGSWEKEERVSVMPFRRGEDFELAFIITSEGYQMNVNGQQLYLFKHRMAPEQVRVLQIDGDVSVQTITIVEVEEGYLGDDLQDAVPPGDSYLKVAQYWQPISNLKPGTSLYFQGSLPDDIDRFDINLKTGEGDDYDTALRFNPQFEPSDVVLFNSSENGKWGEEERVSKMPFRKGKSFELVFNITEDGYQVEVDGQELYLFKHRLDVNEVRGVEINGNVSMQSMTVEQGIDPDFQQGRGFQTTSTEVISGVPIYNPDVPYSTTITGGMSEETNIVVAGIVPPGADSFSCNLLVKSSGDIGLQLKRVPEGTIARNSCLGGNWGEEEREADFNPFQEGSHFEMVICCRDSEFKVFVNGEYMCKFSHRLKPFTDIDTLEVTGDVQLSYVML